VLLTAALDVYAASVADRLGFDACLSARVEVEHGRCTGRVVDADLTGETKVRRLRAWLGDRAVRATVVAYGNSSDDDAVLAWAAQTQRRAPGLRHARERTGPPDGHGARRADASTGAERQEDTTVTENGLPAGGLG
jgi:phosphoserine phosphatase